MNHKLRLCPERERPHNGYQQISVLHGHSDPFTSALGPWICHFFILGLLFLPQNDSRDVETALCRGVPGLANPFLLNSFP